MYRFINLLCAIVVLFSSLLFCASYVSYHLLNDDLYDYIMDQKIFSTQLATQLLEYESNIPTILQPTYEVFVGDVKDNKEINNIAYGMSEMIISDIANGTYSTLQSSEKINTSLKELLGNKIDENIIDQVFSSEQLQSAYNQMIDSINNKLSSTEKMAIKMGMNLKEWNMQYISAILLIISTVFIIIYNFKDRMWAAPLVFSYVISGIIIFFSSFILGNLIRSYATNFSLVYIVNMKYFAFVYILIAILAYFSQFLLTRMDDKKKTLS